MAVGMTTSDDDPGRGRRRFLNWFLNSSLAALFAAVAYPVARFLSPPDVPESTTTRLEAGRTNDPEFLERGYKIVRFGAEPVLLIRLAQDQFRAFAATCTHLDCIVEYQQAHKRIWCNCHNGEYDLNGQVVGGPPPKPLPKYNVHVLTKGTEAGTIVISKV
jgi:cytochrome b6-f complex iron-sulfur subunit